MKQVFLFFILFISVAAKAQEVDTRVKSFIKDQKLDTFLIYSFPCNGDLFPILDSCKPTNTQYVIWCKENVYFIKRFQLCHTSESIVIDLNNPLQYYLINRQRINKERILPPSYYEYRRNKGRIDTLIAMQTIDHSCYHTFTLSVNQRVVEKSADIYNLEFIKFDNGRHNMYYKYNQNTKFKHLIDLILELISQNDKQNVFDPK